ncbi:MAG: exodeoxyribonuclease VII small subunit [Candidatus Marinimicrobia bacterium]|nr:exodeoxyribonuclease VII small subunit [Candidatus Neomarinimicrobiota bacterium]|tara:strand:+ start:96 stop:320 length:225 start_codon:yes stop_codon:yes gene_type:complete
MSENIDKLTFEQGIKKLENILSKLESEDTPLDQMISLYEEANRLTVICKKKLDDADQRMAKLVKNENGELSEEV